MQLLDDYRVWLDRSPVWRYALAMAVLDLVITSIAMVVIQLVSPVPDPVFFAISTAAAVTAWQLWVRHRDRNAARAAPGPGLRK
ncbi:MAG TPA: hypothetical protein VGM12_31985 [Trebonia sp.]|jgi:flagellar biosynthesis component FlhA